MAVALKMCGFFGCHVGMQGECACTECSPSTLHCDDCKRPPNMARTDAWLAEAMQEKCNACKRAAHSDIVEEPIKLESPPRRYVIISPHTALTGTVNRYMVFWGQLTPDDAERRSFGGYTSDITKCERYTRDEIKDYWKDTPDNLKPVFAGEDFPEHEWRARLKKGDEVAITIDQLDVHCHRHNGYLT